MDYLTKLDALIFIMNTAIKKLLIGLEIERVGVFVVAADTILMKNNNHSKKTCTGISPVYLQRIFFPLL